MGPLIQTALVANDLARVKGRPPPGWGLCGVAIKAAPPQILGLLGSRIVGVLDRKAGMWRNVGHGKGMSVHRH